MSSDIQLVMKLGQLEDTDIYNNLGNSFHNFED